VKKGRNKVIFHYVTVLQDAEKRSS